MSTLEWTLAVLHHLMTKIVHVQTACHHVVFYLMPTFDHERELLSIRLVFCTFWQILFLYFQVTTGLGREIPYMWRNGEAIFSSHSCGSVL